MLREIIITLSIIFGLSLSGQTQENKKHWIVPDYVTGQFAGYTGFISVGAGYNFIDSKYQLGLLYGYVPRSIGYNNISTFALKGTVSLYKYISLKKQFEIHPTLSLALTYETGQNSTLKLPNMYPDNYYATNSFHFPIYAGIKVLKPTKIKIFKMVEYKVEIGTLGTYIYYYLNSPNINPNRVLSLSFSVNLFFGS